MTSAALITAADGLTPAASGASAAAYSPVATVSFPSTPAAKQARWLLDSVQHHPIPAAQIAAHFDATYLATLPAPAATTLNASFEGVAHLQLDKVTVSTPESIGFVVTSTGRTSSR